MNYQIRKFQKKDANRCSEIIISCIKRFTDINSKTRQFLVHENSPNKLQYKLTKKYLTFIYELDGKVVGIGALDGNQITRSFVSPDFQRKGIGTKIIKILKKTAKTNGFNNLVVESALDAEGFYKKLGFMRLRKIKKKENDAVFELILMTKLLKQN